MTLLEFGAWMEGVLERRQAERDLVAFHAWAAAAMTRQEKMPTLPKWLASLRDSDAQDAAGNGIADALRRARIHAATHGLPAPAPRKLG